MVVESDEIGRCPACGDLTIYCGGHGLGIDPYGATIMAWHEDGDHSACNPEGCDEVNGERKIRSWEGKTIHTEDNWRD